MSKKAQRHKGTKAQSVKIYLALPCLDELESISQFIACVKQQSFSDSELLVCVNQPDLWWDDPSKVDICRKNQETLEYLNSIKDFPITVLDRASKGKGWSVKNYGVGWARKTVMDTINEVAHPDDIIVSLDADTTFNPGYLNAINESLSAWPTAVALSVPYHHHLTSDEITNRCILRYEIYMRYYALNKWRINNPYCFTAIGSAMAFPVWAYRAVGGITPLKSGEDFYFMQKLRKYGEIIHWCEEKVYPAARFSDRVFFGTGPAMIKGRSGDWNSYPIYDYHLFEEVKKTFDLFPALFDEERATPMDGFLRKAFRSENIWIPLRKNYKSQEQFVKACINKVDGLRILQYLKMRHKEIGMSRDENNLKDFLLCHYIKEDLERHNVHLDNIDFSGSSITEIDRIRNFLEEKENLSRRSP